ncbi:mannose-6-phosphate isomerase, class I [Aestuariivivens sp. NBU2969]|uniref:mannose-6-phosphate isomerase, class I n=1 Tax=Aestuariivivens sp. NBU2969 TaxID=2873267 RepID=UPI001CBCAF5A|nr:mannose-6-phosphate isomerase, class I [Aestuariivivens sp. NBU2969]
MSKLHILKGKLQHYAWGGKTFIPNLLGMTPDNKTYAEYWLGAHDNAPSVIETSSGERLPLNEFLNSNLSTNLGTDVAKTFGRLPFLFKVLDVHDMLSIQVHPTKKEAEKGFKKENELGIPIAASHRNYKDDNHKPEIMVALSEFWLLHGFLTRDKLIKILQDVPEFNYLLPVFANEGYLGLYRNVMEQTTHACNKVLKPLVNRILPLYQSGKLEKSSPDYWAAKAVDAAEDKTNFDKGIYSIYFFNIVKVNPGEAVFQDAGIPHAYLEGQNMELMANSDNVLRGGLTPKHVDVPELLKHVAFEATIPNVMVGELQTDGMERVYKTPAPDFELSKIEVIDSNDYSSKAKSAQILIVIDGKVEVSEADKILMLSKGESVFLESNCNYGISSLTPSATLYKATTP